MYKRVTQQKMIVVLLLVALLSCSPKLDPIQIKTIQVTIVSVTEDYQYGHNGWKYVYEDNDKIQYTDFLLYRIGKVGDLTKITLPR